MVRRSTRRLSPVTVEKLLDEMGKTFKAAVDLVSTAPIGGPEYVATTKLIDAIHTTAEGLTGNRRHFLAPDHSTGPGMAAHVKP